MRFCLRTVAVTLVSLFSLGTFVFAQSANSSLRGTVTDPKGAVVSGATVTLANASTGFSRTVKSGSDGVYQFLEVPPATYVLTVTVAGFATIKQDNVILQVSQPATLDITLQIAGTTEVVEVSGAAPLVNTTDASQGNVFNSIQLTSLPSEGRDPVSILSLQPGVTYLGNTNFDNTKPNLVADSRAGSVAGARSDQTNVTVDGLDNNDQVNGYAFQGALRVPLDSIQEFRVTTTNSNADSGRSSGAQVNMVTKSGTNKFHGTLYEYNRSNIGQANDWFNKQAEIIAGEPNKPGVLHRNTFGAWVGGPIKKDRLFFFGGYEGQRTNEAVQTTHVVPSETLRQGIMQYPCGADPLCVPTTLASTGGLYSVDANGIASITPAGLSAMDQACATAKPDGTPATCNWTAAGFQLDGGANPYVANINGTNPDAVFGKYPLPNTDSVGYGLDFRGFTFAAPNPTKHDTYILRLDYKLTQSGKHNLFVKGHLQNWHTNGVPQFPGLPSNDFQTNNSKGLFTGYTALFTNNLINNLRYGFVRQGLGDTGLGVSDYNFFRGMANFQGAGFTPSTFTTVPVHNIVDDVSWTKGKHTIQFGGNLRIITDNPSGNGSNYSYAYTNVYWLDNAGLSGTGTSLDPGAAGYPTVDSSFSVNYDFAMSALAGLLPEVNKQYNQDKNGHFYAPGELIKRSFRNHEAEFYLQDAWRVTPNLVLTGGLRYSLLQPPYEMNGNQVSPTISLNNWFKQRGDGMLAGQTLYSQTPGGLVQMELGGQANGKRPFWNWDYKDIAPRFAFAYSPHAEEGFLHKLFGSAGKSSIRGGYGIYYDHFGEAIVNTFDRNGAFGLTTALNNPAGFQNVDCTPRMTSLFTLPSATTTYCGQQVVGPPPATFPNLVTPPTLFDPGSFAIYWGMDDKLRTPYSHVFDLSITRDLGHDFVFEASYIGRLGHRLLQEEDLAMPLDIVDPSSKMNYFKAATMLTQAANAGTDISQLAPIPFWEDLFPAAAGQLGFGPSGLGNEGNIGCAPGGNPLVTNYTATQAMYDMYSCFPGNETTALLLADLVCLPACSQLPGQTSPQAFNFWDDQFSSLYAWRSIGNSSYNALQLTLRHAMSRGLQFDFNYTYSKSIDLGSNAERINEIDGYGFSRIINSWSPNQMRAVSDFDMRHQINANWVYELPFGRGRRFGSSANKFVDAVLGGWGLSGIIHWTSGLPFSMNSGAGWSTNWEWEGTAVQTGPTGKVGVFRDADGTLNMFQDTKKAQNAFRFPYPGESGQRNNLRGQGYLELDSGLYKSWRVTEAQNLKFSWELFNVTNTPRFDAAQGAANFDLTSGIFGAYTNTLSTPRVMQFGLRYEF
jgi:Carboxypeptidase regulatory-like domain